MRRKVVITLIAAMTVTGMHYQVAEDHGYTEIADVDIMDEEGSMTLPVTGDTNLEELDACSLRSRLL